MAMHVCIEERKKTMEKMNETMLQEAYAYARKRYAALGVDTDAVLKAMKEQAISLHCWQGDDVRGFRSEERRVG